MSDAASKVPALARLPAGEQLLWQGVPAWSILARRAFHVRKVTAYFGLLLAWRLVDGGLSGLPLPSLAASALVPLLLAIAAISVLTLLAWLATRSTAYAITSRRVLLQIGVALPMTVNIPLHLVQSAALRGHRDGSGDIVLVLPSAERVAYLVLWPHVRPWRFARPQPMLRALPDAAEVAQILAEALASTQTEHPLLRPHDNDPAARPNPPLASAA